MEEKTPYYAIGVDYGTNSCRALVVDTRDGHELATHVFPYPCGKDGVIIDRSDPNVARQNPADYIVGFILCVREAVNRAVAVDPEFSVDLVKGIGIDSTGSTPIPVDRIGIPLAMKKDFKKNPAAHAWLWKDHTSFREAAEITQLAKTTGVPYLAKCGGTYSSEWFWAKILHCMRTAREVFNAAYSWVELCDFIPAYITDTRDPLKMKRSVCAAGHKAMYSKEWGGLPSKKFLSELSPRLALLRDRLYTEAVPSDHIAGRLCSSVAKKVGLPPGIAVAVGAFDCHHGAVGAGVKDGTLVKIIGTSTCDVMVSSPGAKLADIPGICGLVDGSVIPGSIGLEAGQSAVGDIFKWYVDTNCPKAYADGNPYSNLEYEAAALQPGESGLVALDWNNGNRTILVNPLLTGMIAGLTLHTTGAEIYRALVESTAFGALTIIRRVEEYGVKVKEVVNCGGLAEKSPFMMQIYADIIGKNMKISRSAQTCALGAAIFGAVAGGVFKSTLAAQKAMTGVKSIVYKPIPANVKVYKKLYAVYKALHDSFGVAETAADLSEIMPELIAIRQHVRKGR